MFPLFLKRTADVMAPRLSVVFRRLVRPASNWGDIPACRSPASRDVTPIPKGPPSSSVANYRPISITSVLTKAVLLKLSDVADRQVFFSMCQGRQAKQAGPLILFLSFLENIRVPADDGTRTVTGTRTTLRVALV